MLQPEIINQRSLTFKFVFRGLVLVLIIFVAILNFVLTNELVDSGQVMKQLQQELVVIKSTNSDLNLELMSEKSLAKLDFLAKLQGMELIEKYQYLELKKSAVVLNR